ncbi:Dur3p KNAG_0C05580 [Huiozyma naganishii CBS 8797]|uniref:Urea active transporter n=1 Tax=Huiozyma naganishii (strain ATCC MYA-139 / BCRC 22969 / CBS 8797 / KCTC 17520 / NBRC 10181 / NCYC 3082 / Yp74L-3) TaxID=1071383 RepID=J7S6B5_HUIN7|nr:hypothetical protein KNAG_0C05580 [Kazachstania naganishii CBS 8797]CCK69656.1 hypothetical protein KNAG_0C05580 [Kazachstania naganishii CBS 8797]
MGEFKEILPQGAGYAIVVGLGAVFTACMIATTKILKRYQKEIMTAEEFSTAGRTVKTGLVASAVVSSWIWASTLLTSTAMQYNNGVFGGYTYSAGASFQIIAFSILAIKTKQKAPNAHTYLEIVKVRYGKVGHCIYLFYALATNILVTAMLLTSGSAVFSRLTGMNSIACAFLLPIGVVIYTMIGGIKATFLTDYVHTCAIIIIVMYFAFKVYATSDILGSPGKVYDLVRAAAKAHPVAHNYKGEYMTMTSRGAGIFLVINLVGNFGTVFLDNGYWNKAISASPAAALPGYVMGGLAWMPVPFLISLTMGFAALATEHLPSFPTYPDRLSDYEVSSGLVLPAAAVTVMGKGGAVATLLMIFLAVTSGFAAEVISVSSVFTYDIYRPYINPKATGKQLIYSSHLACFVFGVGMSGFAIGLNYGGVSMGYIYEIMGIIISSAVIPVVLTLCWKQPNFIAMTVSPVLGTGLAIMSWLVCTKSLYGTLTIENTFMDYPMLTGNVVALLSPMIFIPILTYVFKPQNFDWELLKSISRADESEEINKAAEEDDHAHDLESKSESIERKDVNSFDGKDVTVVKSGILRPVNTILSSIREVSQSELNEELDAEKKQLSRGLKIAYALCIFFAFAFLVVWPLPMYGTHYIFSKRFFTGWVVVLIIWIFISSFCVIIYPLYEGRHGLYTTFRGIYWDLTGQTYKLREWQNEHPEELHIVQSQLSARRHHVNGGYINIEDNLDDLVER